MSTERLQEILLDQYVRNREVREYFKNIRFDEDDMLTGVFQTEDEGCGCRYNWLYMDSAFAANKECKYIDLSYTKLDADVAGKYTTWDWLEQI